MRFIAVVVVGRLRLGESLRAETHEGRVHECKCSSRRMGAQCRTSVSRASDSLRRVGLTISYEGEQQCGGGGGHRRGKGDRVIYIPYCDRSGSATRRIRAGSADRQVADSRFSGTGQAVVVGLVRCVLTSGQTRWMDCG